MAYSRWYAFHGTEPSNFDFNLQGQFDDDLRNINRDDSDTATWQINYPLRRSQTTAILCSAQDPDFAPLPCERLFVAQARVSR